MYLLLTRLEIVVQCNAFKATWCVSFGMATRQYGQPFFYWRNFAEKAKLEIQKLIDF